MSFWEAVAFVVVAILYAASEWHYNSPNRQGPSPSISDEFTGRKDW